jgi:2-hydroxy-3-keto-5-methylthiopentenyl-1-phosphate phosphatase
MQDTNLLAKHYLLASDFDQTLSFNDSGLVLSELVGIPAKEFERKVAILAVQNFVQQGGELSYLLLHDPDYRKRVRKHHLSEAGKGVHLKKNIKQLSEFVGNAVDGYRFDFHVISASPQEVIESALDGIIAADHIHGTRLAFSASGEIASIVRVNAGYGKVAVLDDLQRKLQIGPERVTYVGDGSSDVHVMLHVNRRDGFTIAVSQARYLAPIAKRSVLSDDALSILVPILEEVVGWDASQIRTFFEDRGLLIQEWDRVRADWLTIAASPGLSPSASDASSAK